MKWLFTRYLVFFGVFLVFIPTMFIAEAMPIPELVSKRLSIQASHSELNQKKRIAIFVGNVELTQENTHLQAQRLEITFNENNKITKAVATGAPASYWNTSSSASNKLVASNKLDKSISAQAEKIIYYPASRKVELWGHAKASQNENTIEGPYIEYQLENGHLISEANEKSRTTIILYSADFQNHSPAFPTSKNTLEKS